MPCSTKKQADRPSLLLDNSCWTANDLKVADIVNTKNNKNGVLFQVKPLLQVTNTEEKINQKEAELKQVADRFEKLRLDHDDLEKQHKQILEEKNALAEQLQAETELASEAEEVSVAWFSFISFTKRLIWFVAFVWFDNMCYKLTAI